jgi:hypothetical protein
MARSKSPAKRIAAAAGITSDAHVQAAITVALIAGLIFLDGGADAVDPRSGGWVKFFNGGGKDIHASFPYGWIITLHTLNTVQNSGGDHFIGSLVNAFIAVFAPLIVNGFFFEGASITAQATTSNIGLVAVCWYVTNHAPFGVDVWGQIKDVAGDALDGVLSTASVAFTTAAAISAAGSFSALSPDAAGFWAFFGVGYQCFKAAVVASAGNYVPLNKGFSFDGFDAASEAAFVSAAWMAFYASVDALKPLDAAAGLVGATSVGSAQFVVFANVLVHLLGVTNCPAIPSPLPAIQDKIYEFTGLSN